MGKLSKNTLGLQLASTAIIHYTSWIPTRLWASRYL